MAGAHDPRPVLVIGGAGFVGSNLAHRLAAAGHPVRVFDNLSRPGVEHNASWLYATHGGRVDVTVADVADRAALRRAIAGASAVFHLAGQVAVTTSLEDPIADCRANLWGTLNVLEELRALRDPPPLVFTSTNKVYGELEDVDLEMTERHYQPRDASLRHHGIGERRELCLRSPYGCSKGAADQYVLDYAKTFGLRTVVFRMSCIYGPHQFGNEEQGWVAHFALRSLQRAEITIYGDGKQVRDILFVDDLVDAFERAMAYIDRLSGRAFNIGGGPGQRASLLDVLDLLEELRGEPVAVRFAPWRPGDQRYYVSDIRAFRVATGWKPRIGVRAGVEALHDWLRACWHDPRRAARAHQRCGGRSPEDEGGPRPEQDAHAAAGPSHARDACAQ